ncbi:hypothetical protein OF83DRAFT_1098683 [Amylostereum chailletii]|nr:hypothetical protein OF83DRAFT_1098683 [Amylostereum chailletii]
MVRVVSRSIVISSLDKIYILRRTLHELTLPLPCCRRTTDQEPCVDQSTQGRAPRMVSHP